MRVVPIAAAAVLMLACASSVGLVDAVLLSVRGVTIGSPRSAVLAALGSPSRTETGYDDIMGMGAWERLIYDGLTVEVISPDSDSQPPSVAYAAIIEISGAAWVTRSGLRVGSPLSEVMRLLGRPDRVEGEAVFYYTKRFDGHVRIEFRGNVVRLIEIDEDWT